MFNRYTANRIIRLSDTLSSMDEVEFREHISELRLRLLREGICSATLKPTFAMIREASGRALGMRHHHTQIQVSLIMLRGMAAEMATGEGKTLACTLASITAALAGVRVHVVTTNDYLAQRDCEEMRPLFDYLGVTSRALVNESTLEERQLIYSSDIMYCANNELV
ncbi:MAG: preprotein translocase subunit SecA, partial [Halieaceae bacterium]